MPLTKNPETEQELRWSEWLESLRKDVESSMSINLVRLLGTNIYEQNFHIPIIPLFQYLVGTWRGYCETIPITTLVLWDCRFALPAFPSSPCLNTRSEHDVATVKLYLLLRWYCETVGLPYQHSLLPLVSIPGRNMTWLQWNCTYYYAGTMKL